jgi:hypothetical protein
MSTPLKKQLAMRKQSKLAEAGHDRTFNLQLN